MAKKLELDLESLPSTREQALKDGVKWFYTRKPCKKGHLAARPVSSSTCMECHRLNVLKKYQENPAPFIEKEMERQRQWKEEDPKGFAEYQRQKMANWRADNPDAQLVVDRRYKNKHADVIRGRQRDSYAKNPEAGRRKNRNWRAANPEKAAESYRQWCRKNPTKAKIKDQIKRARRLGAPGVFNEKDVNTIRKWQDGKCVFCRLPLNEVGETIEHFIPVSGSGTNWPWNIGLSCPSCNFKKWKKEVIEFCIEQGFPLTCILPTINSGL